MVVTIEGLATVLKSYVDNEEIGGCCALHRNHSSIF